MIHTTLSINGRPEVPCYVSTHTEQIETSSFGRTEPDPTWEHRDAAEHYHAFDHAQQLPTLIRREVSVPFEVPSDYEPDEDEIDSTTEIRYHCLICDQHVEPRWRYVSTAHYRTFAPGRTTYEIRFQRTDCPTDFSAVVRGGDRMYFGIGHLAIPAELLRPEDQMVAYCGPMSWRADPRKDGQP